MPSSVRKAHSFVTSAVFQKSKFHSPLPLLKNYDNVWIPLLESSSIASALWIMADGYGREIDNLV